MRVNSKLSEHGCEEKLRSTKGCLTLKRRRPENFCNAEGKMLVENKVVDSGQIQVPSMKEDMRTAV